MKVLLVQDDVQQANRFISVLRSAGYKPEARHITLEAELPHALESWQPELVIADLAARCIAAKALFTHLRQSGRDLEVLITTDDWDPVATLKAFRLGACAVIPCEEDQLLIEAVGRALVQLDTRRDLRQWQRRYRQSEERCIALLEDARHAIAIVQDGAHIRVNDTYAHLLGYAPDALVGLPVLDTVHQPDEAFRRLLKPESADAMYQPCELDLTLQDADGGHVPAHLRVAPVFHGDAAALEFRIDSPADERELKPAPKNTPADSPTRIAPQNVIEQLATAIRRSAHTRSDSAQLYLEVADFETLRSELGIAQAEQVAEQLAQLIAAQLPDHYLGRLREDTLVAVVSDVSREAALDIASELSAAVSSHVFTLDSQTRQIAVHIGASLVCEAIGSADASIELGLRACREAARQGHPHGGVAFLDTPTVLVGEGDEETDVAAMGRLLLKRKGFRVLYQPVVNLRGERAHYYDVLLGVAPDALDTETPPELIADLFRSELATELDRLVIATALRALETRQATQPSVSQLIRLSEASWFDDDFLAWLEGQFRASTLSPASVVFQLNEASAARHLHRAEQVAERLTTLGCGLALADFGLALNPMDIAARLRPSLVKLDRQLTLRAGGSAEDQKSLADAVRLLDRAGYRVIAPFAESASIIPALWKVGVDCIQGLYIQPPMPTMDYEFDED